MTQIRKLLYVALVIPAAITGLVSCGVPSSSEFSEIAVNNLPAELSQTTTSTSTSTTTTTVAIEGEATTTTVAEILNEPIELYYISANRVLAVILPIASPATTSQVLAALIAGPPSGDAGVGLRSALPITLNATITISDGVAAIDTSSEFLTGLTPIDQRLAIAQLVLTFTRRPGVGQVVFTVEGQQIAVPRGRGDLTKPGTQVSFDDYSSLIIAPTG